jgi:hypothetical protein
MTDAKETERDRITRLKDEGRLSWRQYVAGIGFIDEAIRRVQDLKQRGKAKEVDAAAFRTELAEIQSAYHNWRDANEQAEHGFFMRGGVWEFH